MKTQMLIIVIVVIMIILSPLYGQSPDKQSHRLSREQLITQPEPGNTLPASSGSYTSRNTPSGNPGTAYLDPDFSIGNIEMENGVTITDIPMRYNLYSQQMQYIDGNDTLAIGNPHEIASLQIGNKIFVYTAYICDNELRQGYFELLEEGECRLLKRYFAMFYTKDPGREDSDECGIFYRDCNCFLQFGNKPATTVSNKRKNFISAFGNQAESISNLMRTENLKPSREADLQRIVAFYNLLY